MEKQVAERREATRLRRLAKSVGDAALSVEYDRRAR
jgi:hypothetical protein